MATPAAIPSARRQTDMDDASHLDVARVVVPERPQRPREQPRAHRPVSRKPGQRQTRAPDPPPGRTRRDRPGRPDAGWAPGVSASRPCIRRSPGRPAAGALQHLHPVGGELPGPCLGAEIGADPGLDQRLGQLPDVEVRIEHPAHALGHRHGLLQQHAAAAAVSISNWIGHGEQLAEQAAERDLVQRQAQDRLADGAAGLLERRPGPGRPARTRRGSTRRRPAGSRRSRKPTSISARWRAGRQVEPAHDAEIERHDVAVGRRSACCPGCMSAWKKPSRNTWLKNTTAACGQDPVGIVAGGDQPIALVDRAGR